MKKFPVVLFGKEYHKALYQHLLNLAEYGTIAKEDMDLFLYTDSIEEAKAHVEQYTIQQFGLKKIRGERKPSTLLGEWSWKNK